MLDARHAEARPELCDALRGTRAHLGAYQNMEYHGNVKDGTNLYVIMPSVVVGVLACNFSCAFVSAGCTFVLSANSRILLPLSFLILVRARSCASAFCKSFVCVPGELSMTFFA